MPSELRQDPVSGDWVIIAPARAVRPKMLDAPKHIRKPAPLAGCLFEFAALAKSDQWPPIADYGDLIVVPNKYPAITHAGAQSDTHSVGFHHGIYYAKTGVGSHELIIGRDHDKNFADLTPTSAAKILGIMQDRYHAADKKGCSEYVVPFFNWGPAAGASIWHPHYQVLAIPAVPTHTTIALENAKKYFTKHGRCLRCDMIAAEQKEHVRIVDENAKAIALTPYASKVPFEVMILPKRHASYFRDAKSDVVLETAKLLQSVMKRLKRFANDPDLNFFIHDAPLGEKRYAHHHWHIEILPRISIPAGFEFSTGMYIEQVAPENAAAILRGDAAKQK